MLLVHQLLVLESLIIIKSGGSLPITQRQAGSEDREKGYFSLHLYLYLCWKPEEISVSNKIYYTYSSAPLFFMMTISPPANKKQQQRFKK